jgi:RNA polymerase sigma factor (sigma-70 family)
MGELRPMVVRTARLVVGAGSAYAEDAAQDALIDLDLGLAGLRRPEAIRAWAMRVATTRALKTLRRERLRLRVRPPAEAELAYTPPSELTATLKEAFDRLPPRQRAVAVLRLYSGLSEQETADVLECSVGSVKSQLHDARRSLQASLREAGVSAEAGA